MPSGRFASLSHLPGRFRRATRAPRYWTKKPVLGSLAWLLGLTYHAWMSLVWRTARVQVTGLDQLEHALHQRRGAVVGLYHDSILLAPYACRALQGATIVNRSDIGTLITGPLKRMGCHVIRGGTSRGKARRAPVLHQLAAHLEHHPDHAVFIAVDGSHGPAHVVKPGLVTLARRTGAPLFLFAAAARPDARFPTWDRTRLPLPLPSTRLTVRLERVADPHELDDPDELLKRVQTQLDDATARVETTT